MFKVKSGHYIDTVIHSADVIVHSIKSLLRQEIEDLNLGITSEQFLVLDTISYHPNIHQQKLSELIMKDKSNTTRILGILENKGLISRTVGKNNNRLVNILNITSEGKHIVEDNLPKLKGFIERLFTNLDDEEVAILHSLSDKIQTDLSIRKELIIK